jgi:hypothetical protein
MRRLANLGEVTEKKGKKKRKTHRLGGVEKSKGFNVWTEVHLHRGEYAMNTIHRKNAFQDQAMIDALDYFYKITFVTKQEIQQ